MKNKINLNSETWVLINGEVYALNQKVQLSTLFEFLGNTKLGLITEYNQIIVKPESSKKILLNNLDRIEFVTIVGGG